MRRWCFATTYIGEYFPEKRDEDMIEYKSDVFHPFGNYKLEEIIENLNSHKNLKNSRTKLSIDHNKLKVRLLSEWDVDFTVPNSTASVLGFENKVLEPSWNIFLIFRLNFFNLKRLMFIATLLTRILWMNTLILILFTVFLWTMQK